jgi:hypothetical protein
MGSAAVTVWRSIAMAAIAAASSAPCLTVVSGTVANRMRTPGTQPSTKARRRGRALLTAAVGMAAAGFSLAGCGFSGTIPYDGGLDCDGGDHGSIYCPQPDAGPGDGG